MSDLCTKVEEASLTNFLKNVLSLSLWVIYTHQVTLTLLVVVSGLTHFGKTSAASIKRNSPSESLTLLVQHGTLSTQLTSVCTIVIHL